MATYCNAFKMETDENKFGFAQNPDSFESWQGRRGPYYTPVVSADGTLSWVNNGGLPNPQPVNIAGPPGQGLEIQGVVETVQQLPTGAAQGDVWLVGTDSPYEAFIWVSGGWLDLGQVAVGPQGPEGEPGTDGVSPEVAVTEISGGHRVTITDADGTQTFDVLDGEDGQPGSPGAAGVSPDVTVTAITGGHRVTITDAGGTQTFDVLDGEDGQPGSPGAAGVSPDVTVTAITGGHRVTITDAGGTQTFDVMDGAQGGTGPAGPGVPTGGSVGQILAKVDGTNYNTHWINPPDPSGYVSYAQTQTLTAAQQTRARGNIGANWVLLWQNASPTSDFSAQTIPLDYSTYNFLAIVVRSRTDQPVQTTVIFEAESGGGYTTSKNTIIPGGCYWQYRQGTLNSTGLAIENALECHFAGAFSYDGVSNPTLIPLYIYGITNL